MAGAEYPMERRAHQLAGRLRGRIDTIRDSVRPPGQRPPFTQQLSKADARAFWTRHRHDSIGAEVLANMTPQDILELDTAMAQGGMQDEQSSLPY